MRPSASPDSAAAATARRALALVALATLLAMSSWFVGSALAPQLRERWHLSAATGGWLTSAVQLGFVAGTACAALLNLADLLPARALFAASAAAAALSNAALLVVPGFAGALASRFATGFFLAGVYPPAMKMVATWHRAGRGLAIGTLVGAITVGSATPFLTHSLGPGAMTRVALVASFGALLAAALVALLYRDGPYPFERRPFSWSLAASALHDRDTRLAMGGYLGHMWELYAAWTWLPAFIAASFNAHFGSAPGAHRELADLAGFLAIAAGGAGCVWGGWAAGRAGYARVVTWSMAASGACALAIGLLFGGSPWPLVALACVWGFFVVADSAQFSALVTEVAPSHAVGTALMLQTSAGFLLTMATIQLVPLVVGRFGWAWAFPALALGPAFGIAAIAKLPRGR